MDIVEVQQRARQFISPLDLSNVRNDLAVYLKAANAVLVKEELGPGESGTTFTKPNGTHIITVNVAEVEERQRFTICHEVGHIILKLTSSHDVVPSWSYAKRDTNEISCDIFAAELLMPHSQWLAKCPGGLPSHDTIELMASEFRCSYHSAASRYAVLAQIPCALVTMEGEFIRHAARSTALRRRGAWISPRTTIPEGSVAYAIRREGRSQIDTREVSQDIWFQDWDSGFDLTEMSRYYKSSDTTLSLLWFEDEDLPERDTDRFGRVVEDDGGLRELTGELPWPGKRKRR